jgi:hypothetical protein
VTCVSKDVIITFDFDVIDVLIVDCEIKSSSSNLKLSTASVCQLKDSFILLIKGYERTRREDFLKS